MDMVVIPGREIESSPNLGYIVRLCLKKKK
jgi:hypothetical protein